MNRVMPSTPQIVTIADGKSVQLIGNLKTLFVVHGNRPEGVHRANLALADMNDVFACAVQRIPLGIGLEKRINRVLRLIGAQSDLRNDRPFEIVVAINPHRIGIHLPTVHDPCQRRNLIFHLLEPIYDCTLKPSLYLGWCLGKVETLTGFDANPFHPGYLGPVGDMRRILLHQFRGIAEILRGWHGIHLHRRRRLHVNGRVGNKFSRYHFLAPLRKWSNLVSILHFVHGFVVFGTICLGAADDPDI